MYYEIYASSVINLQIKKYCHLGLFKDGDKSTGKDGGTDKNGGTDRLGQNSLSFFSKQPQPTSEDLENENELNKQEPISDELPQSYAIQVN